MFVGYHVLLFVFCCLLFIVCCMSFDVWSLVFAVCCFDLDLEFLCSFDFLFMLFGLSIIDTNFIATVTATGTAMRVRPPLPLLL